MVAITPRNFWFWFGGIWLAVGSPFLLIGSFLAVQEASLSQRLEADGRTVQGLVLTKSRRTSSSSSGRSGSPIYEITYRFLTAEGTVQGKAQVPGDTWDSLVEREPIGITYLPDDPRRHRVAGQSSGWILPAIFAGLGSVFTLIGGIVLLRARSRLRITRRLQREGVTASATITDIRPTRVRINGVQQVDVVYRYQDEQGRSHSGKETFSPEEAEGWKEGTRVAVRYDRRKPNHSIWVGTP
jgi:hypothetical protein